MNKTLSLFVLVHNLCQVQAFRPISSQASSLRPLSSRLEAGQGMGMAAPSKKKGKKSKGKSTGGTTAPFDVSASLLRLEKKYDELMTSAAKQLAKEEEDPRWATNPIQDDLITSEFIIAARSTKAGGMADWIPVAQLCLARPESEYENGGDVIHVAVSAYCRELSHIAAFGAPVFSTVARSDLQYAIEPIDSFHKHVFENVIEGANDKEMTKSAARSTLGLDGDESDRAVIKQAYRKLSFELHPDRFEGSEGEREDAATRFGQVKLAYETLSSGVREDGKSWYESLGGRSRTEFVGPVNLLPLSAAQEQLERRRAQAAIVGLEKDLIQTFVARNLRSS